MTSSDDIYKGSTASDYQPPTQNPQSTSTDLQPKVMGIQTSDVNSDVAQQRLPTVSNLKVVVIQDSRSTTRAEISPPKPATQTWVGPFWGCVALGILILIIWVVRILAKEETPKLSEAIEEAIHEPIVETPLAPVTKTSKSKSKNPHHRKKKNKKK